MFAPALGCHDQVVGGRERSQQTQDLAPDLGFIAKLGANDGLYGRDLVLQPMCKFADGELAKLLFLFETA